MSLKSIFILPSNPSACKGAMCCGDPACPDQHCQGKNQPPQKAPEGRSDLAAHWIGVEAALPVSFTADPPKAREPIDWPAVVIYGAVVVACCAVAYLSTVR
jgi:hypothetical protein